MTSELKIATDAGALSLAEQAVYQPINIHVEAGFAQFDGRAMDLIVGFPTSYMSKKRRRYPLLILLEGGLDGTSAIELSRMMTETKEVQEAVVVGLRFAEPLGSNCLALASLLAKLVTARLLPHCQREYRINPAQVMVYGHGCAGAMVLSLMLSGLKGISQFVASSPALALGSGQLWSAAEMAADRSDFTAGTKLFICSARDELVSVVSRRWGSDRSAEFFRYLSSLAISGLSLSFRELQSGSLSDTATAGLADALQRFWATGSEYGKGMTALGKPWVNRLCRWLGPVSKNLLKPAWVDCPVPGLVMNAQALGRQFEVFVDLPESYSSPGLQRYPLVLMLDANYSYALGRQTLKLMHQNGEVDEAIVVGLGVPRQEGNIAFGLRRLEEFSPPLGDYRFEDELGRILGSVYALQGRDIAQHFGRAEGLHDFIVNQLLPLLQSSLRIDGSRQVLFGHSAGGTFTAFTLMQPDCPFSGLICSSPGLAITDYWLEKHANHNFDAGTAREVVLGVGSLEFDNAFNQAAGIPGTPAFAQQLAAHKDLKCSFFELENEGHSSVFVRTLARGLAIALGRHSPPA